MRIRARWYNGTMSGGGKVEKGRERAFVVE
jgi:hypothetical protein